MVFKPSYRKIENVLMHIFDLVEQFYFYLGQSYKERIGRERERDESAIHCSLPK